MKKKIKFQIKKGKLVTTSVKSTHIVSSKDAYGRYKELATTKYGLKQSELLSKDDFITVVAGEEAKGRGASAARIAKLHAFEGYTDKELALRWKLYEGNLSKKQFYKQKEYAEVDERAAVLNRQLKIENGIIDEYGNLLMNPKSHEYHERMANIAAIISTQIYGSK